MSDEIIGRLDELRAGQDALRAELLGAVSQSNEAVMGAVQALSTEVRSLRGGQDSLRTEVLQAISESNEAVLGAINALHSAQREIRTTG